MNLKHATVSRNGILTQEPIESVKLLPSGLGGIGMTFSPRGSTRGYVIELGYDDTIRLADELKLIAGMSMRDYTEGAEHATHRIKG
ncbi:MAG: hypothetical protein ABSH40_06225 [Bryobacteraceae bacterium]